MVGQSVLHYKITEKLGEGGMGVVYKAHDTKLDRFVALKFLPSNASVNADTKARFTQEAKAAAALNHPNICTIHGVEESDGNLFIVMEYIDGGTLRDKVPYQKIDDAVSVAIQIGEALYEAHAKGIVHRDVKADNIMLTSKGQVKVMDFGLAKLKGTLKLTRTSSTVGTLAYMAPEQIQGGEVDQRSDIFSFGVLFFEMLTGKFPFRGEHEASLLYSIVNEEPESITRYLPDASSGFQQIFEKALEKDPSVRYHSVEDMVVDLRRLKKQSSRVSRPSYSGEYQAFDSGKRSSDLSTSDHTSAPNTTKIRSMVMYSAAGIFFIASLVIGIFMFKPSENTAFSAFTFSRITSTGYVQGAAISPDNRYICYSQFEKGKYSLWVRQLATSSNIQIRTPQPEFIGDPIFSNDGNFIYYRMQDKQADVAALYRIPVLGGNSVKIISNVQGSVTFSPDGAQFAFNRIYQETGNFALVVASADGSKQKDLVAYKGEKWISGAPSWSPKGDIIAVALGLWEGGFHHELISVDAVSGAVQNLTETQWDGIGEVTWLSDAKGLIVEGTDLDNMLTQLYFVSFPSGTTRKITNDLNNYGGSSVTDDRKKICAVQSERELYMYYVQDGDAKRAVKITQLRDDGMLGLAVSPENKIYYSTRQGGSFDIWSSGLTGENQKQITTDEFAEQGLTVSPDGNTLLFSSPRAGVPNIWSIATDGTGLTQLTSGAEDYTASMDASGKWIVFTSWMRGPQTIMKIPAQGGVRIDLTTENGNSPVISSDGTMVYFISTSNGKRYVASIPIAGGTVKRLFETPKNMSSIQLRPKFNEISYMITTDGVANIYTRPIDGGAQKQFTRFDEKFIASFAWTPDGRSVVVSRGEIRSDVVILSEEKK